MITIKNLRNEKPQHPWDVRVDRASVLGNPYKMEKESQRDEVCDKYKEYFLQRINEEPDAFSKELDRLVELYKEHGKLNLFCWCAPKRCHAETISHTIHILCEWQ